MTSSPTSSTSVVPSGTSAPSSSVVPVAVVTGASQGLGRVLALSLAERGWHLVIDARTADALLGVADEITAAGAAGVTAIPGDVAEPAHRRALADAVRRLGSLHLLVNNASSLGPSPQPSLADYPARAWQHVYDTNVVAPLRLTQEVIDLLRASGGTLVNITSDASVEAYPGWGGYGSSKAALDQWTAVLGAEEPALSVYAFDPGDMRTHMHQLAFPDEDISDRPEPATVVPAFWRLLTTRPASGRYQASALHDVGHDESEVA